MRALNGFDPIAGQYDLLKTLVFGRAIHRSETAHLHLVPDDAKVLILGGGSGEILEALWKSSPKCQIWYVDASGEMLRLARRRVPEGYGGRIRFVHGTQDALANDLVFDVIITNFFLDLFTDATLSVICDRLAGRLTAGGLWLASDFVGGGKGWQRALLAAMYLLFRKICHIEAHALPAWPEHLRSTGLTLASTQSFYGGFIRSALYRKEQQPDDLRAFLTPHAGQLV